MALLARAARRSEHAERLVPAAGGIRRRLRGTTTASGSGGVDLGYGYKSDGTFDFDDCEDAIFFTGQMLRDFRQTPDGFVAGGPLKLDGVQISPARPVRGFNTPPAISYFVNYLGRMDNAVHSGTLGGIRVYRFNCAELGCRLQQDSDVAVNSGPPAAPTDTSPPARRRRAVRLRAIRLRAIRRPTQIAQVPTARRRAQGPELRARPAPVRIARLVPDRTARVERFAWRYRDGLYAIPPLEVGVYKLTTADPLGLGIDTISAYSRVPGVERRERAADTAHAATGRHPPERRNAGQNVTVDICGFNSADPNRQSGKPYNLLPRDPACARAQRRVQAGRGAGTMTSWLRYLLIGGGAAAAVAATVYIGAPYLNKPPSAPSAAATTSSTSPDFTKTPYKVDSSGNLVLDSNGQSRALLRTGASGRRDRIRSGLYAARERFERSGEYHRRAQRQPDLCRSIDRGAGLDLPDACLCGQYRDLQQAPA